MIRVSRLVLFLLLLPFFFQISFSAESGVCCYVQGSIQGISHHFSQTCPAGIEVGKGDFDFNEFDACAEFKQKQIGCVNNGICSRTIQGSLIFDIPSVKNLLGFNSFCGNDKPIDNSCQGSRAIQIGDSTDGSGSSSGGGVVGSSEDFDALFNDTRVSNEIIQLCAKAGGPFGFFGNKNSCESIEIGGEFACIFNPFLGGLILSNTDAVNSNSLLPLENACIPKSEINQCLDYKTEDNCVSNPSKNFSSRLELGCRWVEPQEFSEGLFEEKNGICIENSVDNNKNFDKAKFSFRLNLINNPSFEDGIQNWANTKQSNVALNSKTFHGSKSYVLKKGDLIHQTINNVEPSLSYVPSIYIKVDEINSSSTFELKISNAEFEQTSEVSLEDFILEDLKVFKRLEFNSFVLDGNLSSINISLQSLGQEIEIDAVSLEPTLASSVISASGFFKPVEILSGAASSCESCYDPLNLNLCTKSKSDFLGDCSYMVESPDKPYLSELGGSYLGSEENVYSNTDEWQAQSLSNSKLFCELYLDRNSCIDSSNYVNEKFTENHPFSGSTLCKWNNQFGCFKDSDDNSLPDTSASTPVLRVVDSSSITPSNIIANYKKVSGLTDSDFALSCDSLPPNSYIYFTAKNTSGDEVLLTKSSQELIGDVQIHLEAHDVVLESCSPFNIERSIIVDYEIDSKTGFRKASSNQLQDLFPIKDYFVFQNQELIVDGINNISLIVLDQSGNLDKEWDFSLNVDANAPEINLTSHNYDDVSFFVSNIIGPNTTFNFSITDYSKIDSCSFELSSLTSTPQNFFTGSGDINISKIDSNNILEFKLPISDSSVNPDVYALKLICSDIFNQESEVVYRFRVDFNTEILILDPISFSSHEINDGFLNSSKNFIAVSSEKSLSSCNFDFSNTDFNQANNLVISSDPSGFFLNLIGFDNVKFFKNISGSVDFNSDGFKEGSISCEDSSGNTFTESLKYYYDTQNPILEDFRLLGNEISGIKTVVEIQGNQGEIEYYTTQDNGLLLNLTIDGTGSWLANSATLNLLDITGIHSTFNPRTNTEIFNNTFRGNLIIRNFQKNKIVFTGIPTSEDNLFEIKHDVLFKDKAGNLGNEEITYFFDDSIPEFNFAGDIVTIDGTDLYTKENNPNIDLTFNTPGYRTFTCNSTILQGQNRFQETFGPLSTISFSLSQISSNLRVEEENPVDITLNCIDIYSNRISESFKIIFDDKIPILRSISLGNGNDKYFLNRENLNYNDIIDDLVFDLDDTGEKGYTCSYRFINISNLYSCNTSEFKEDFNSGGFRKVSDLVLVKGNPSSTQNPVCIRTPNFFTIQDQTLLNNESLETSLFVEGFCEDKVGFRTQTQKATISIDYVANELGGLEFVYEDGIAFPIVKSFTNFNTIRISENELGESPILLLSNPVQTEDGLFTYTSNQGIRLDQFEDGDILIFAVVLDDEGNFLERVSERLVIDSVSPTINLRIPDANNDLVQQPNFVISFDVSDLGGQIEKVELFLENDLIFTTENESFFDQRFLEEPQSNLNSFSSDFSGYSGQLFFKGVTGDIYTFTLKAQDTGGNVNESSKTVQVVDGLGITLRDSSNSFVDPTRVTWVTSSKSPIINFETSKVADSCTIFPMEDEEWKTITNNNAISTLNSELKFTKSFSFDLSSFGGYDLSQISDRSSSVKIICLQNNTFINFTRTVQLIDFIPDYVMSSSEGFLFNEEPFQTVLDVKSVGPYRFLNCEYAIGDGSFNSFNERDSTEFKKDLSFEFLGSGTHTLKLQCEDLVGNEGPLKTYDFVINKEARLTLSNVSLSNGVFTFKEDTPSNTIFIGDESNLDISFTTNKKNDVSCSYIINSDTTLNKVIGFFKNLFSIGKVDIEQDLNPFLFKSSGLSFDRDNENTLRIDCRVLGSNSESFTKNFKVIFKDDELGVGVTRTSLN